MEWSRPDTIPYSNIWKRFDGIKKINGKTPKFWIQDVTDDLVESIARIMTTEFIKEEPLCKFSKFAEDEVSVAERTELFKHVITNKLSVICMTNDPEGKPKLAGVSCLTKTTKNDPDIKLSGKCLSKLRNMVDYAYSVKDPFNYFGVDEYLDDKGIYILPEFRRQGICYEFLHVWVSICKAVGMKVVIGLFTSIVSQAVADRVGYKELNSFDYAELEKVNSDYALPGIQEYTKSLRILYYDI